jgi:hypothetical protein
MNFEYEESNGFSAFALYNAIRLHFTSDSYDFFKYNGKTNVSKSSFSSRKDKYTFYKLSRKYKLEELKYFYISNFLEKNVNWIGDITGPDGESVFKEWQSRCQSLTYNFEQDIILVLEKGESLDSMFKVTDGQYPLLLNEVMQRNIKIETFVILNDLLNFFPMWSKKISDTIIWPDIKRKCEKYTPFLNYDKVKFKNIVKQSVKEYA